MRRPGVYDPAKFADPLDRRLAQIIRRRRHSGRAAVNLLGIPFDGAVLGRKGASEGPTGIRRGLSSFSNYNVELGLGLEKARIFDLGDTAFNDQEVKRAQRKIEAEVSKELEKDSLLVLLGGDNSLSLPGLKAYSKKYGEIGLIVVDSHLDLRGEIDGRPSSGSSYGLAIESVEGLDPKRVVEIGVHGFLNSARYWEKAQDLGIKLFTSNDVRKRGAKAIAKAAFAIAGRGAKAVYLSIDLDSVDLAEVSGVSAPTSGGVSAPELCELLFNLARRREVMCADIVELAPSLDPSGRSERVAATALVYLIAGFESRKSR